MVFSVFTSQPNSLLAFKKASVFFLTVFILFICGLFNYAVSSSSD
jgi:hypothetical protein